ncbi:MAG: hypothetical protein ACPGRY_17580, partial [Candidatus Latescibacterota bacterium]
DNSWQNESAAIRARKLAKPRWGDGQRPGEEIAELVQRVNTYNKELDLSFKFSTKKSGRW